jgi:hypothetical protein
MRRLLVAWLSAVVVVLCFIPSVFAAGADPGMKEGGAGFFTTGFTWLDIDELNDALKASPLGLKTFDASVISYGGGGYGIIAGRVIVGGEGYGFSTETTNASYIQRLSGGWGMFDAGYLVFHRAGFRVFPMVGVGGGGMELRITERATLGFDDIMADPKRESLLDIGGFMLSGGVGVDYLLKLGEDKEGYGGLIFGVRAGYTQSFFNSGWSMGAIDIIGGPDVGISGFYLRFVVGGGGYSTGMAWRREGPEGESGR